mgnify:CR=1 FL=1
MKSTYKKGLIGLLLLFLVVSCAAATGYLRFVNFCATPADTGASQILFTVSPGQNLKTIARRLELASIISDSRYFTWLVRIKKADKKLQAGQYLLSAAYSPEKILQNLISGKVQLYKITFPEGLTIAETAFKIQDAGFCSGDRFSELCRDQIFARSLGVNAASLEGYLFPDTYFFPKPTDCEIIIQAMLNRFNQVMKPAWKARSTEMGLTVYDVITLASIIEKETGDASERPVISSVFHNRLKKRMRLESDPTVIYGIKNFDGNITRKHLRTKTPYNTYRIKGLPAGPIANPGALSIEAALYPAQTDYLFFVSKKDTTHYFSKTIQEHNRAVRKYQLRK